MGLENIDAVFASMLAGNYDDESPWEAVRTLRRVGSREVFNRPQSGASQIVDEDVRNWATFSLGVLCDLDSEEIRDALWQRISDPCRDVREESLVGLAKRKDQRAIQVLIAALDQPEISNILLEAAAAFLDEQQTDKSSSDYIALLKKRFSTL